jgi:hypothetical protein
MKYSADVFCETYRSDSFTDHASQTKFSKESVLKTVAFKKIQFLPARRILE